MPESRVTIADVAEKAGVSTQTVSRVINNKGEISNETRDRVCEVIRELGYRPNRIARSLATSQTMTIGLVVTDIANPFFSELTRGAEEVAWEAGYHVLLINTVERDERERAALRLLEETRVDGVILCSSRLCDEELFPLLRSFPSVVLVNRTAPVDVAGVVRTDDYEGGRLAALQLIEAGRKRIAFLAGPEKSFSGHERLRGCTDVLKEANIPFLPELQAHCPPRRKAGYSAALELFGQQSGIDGLICYNDLIAVGALQALSELNIGVPDPVALISYDDIILSRVVCPTLTTIGVSKVELGASAVRLLLERMQGQAAQNEIVFLPKLILRGTTPS